MMRKVFSLAAACPVAATHLPTKQKSCCAAAPEVKRLSLSTGMVHGESTMTKLQATPTQMVHSKLLNRKPILCAICDRYISPFAGLPVILDSKAQIIEFAHPSCCVTEE